jgi:hypothetical protein
LKRCLLVLFLGICCSVIAQPRSREQTFTVCEVFRDWATHSGHMIRIRGLLVSTPEGAYLNGEGCDGVLRTAGFSWPVVIWLTSPTHADVLHKPDFAIDERAFGRFNEILRKKHFDPRQRIWVTYLGLFEAYDNLAERVRRLPDGGLQGYGFGHLAYCPFQLVIKTVSLSDVVVEPPRAK